MSLPVILTGLRANNDLTIGNYFGGMLPIIDMAKHRSRDFQINMFIPDLHSFTTPIDHSQLQSQILHTAKLYAAAGLPLDDDNIHIYRQSYVPAHSELTWILDCFTGMGELSRMTQYKDKAASLGGDRTSAGLFNYPVLMAADILLYGASYVPVGDDQTQHIEFTRDIAMRMNSRFGDILAIPKPVNRQHDFFGKDQGLRIKDLLDPSKKMSKSDESGRGVIFLNDPPDVAAKKIMSAATDDKGYVRFDRANQPGIANLLEILALLREQALADIVRQFEGQTGYGDFKRIVANETAEFLQNLQTHFSEIDETAVLAKLQASETAMREQSGATLYRVQQAVGLRPQDV